MVIELDILDTFVCSKKLYIRQARIYNIQYIYVKEIFEKEKKSYSLMVFLTNNINNKIHFLGDIIFFYTPNDYFFRLLYFARPHFFHYFNITKVSIFAARTKSLSVSPLILWV